MHNVLAVAAAAAVAGIYCAWRAYQEASRRPETLQERVAYMLWVMAQRVE